MNAAPREPKLWWPAFWRMSLAGFVFVIIYGSCNYFTSIRENVPTLMFEWEHHIPFIKEMVVPYWSLDLFFCGAFFLCRSRQELNLLTKRLVTVIILSGICFLLFPLKFGMPRPEPSGWTAPLFKLLYFNDLPYNLAPSLHISLRSLLWVFFGAYLKGRFRTVMKIWFFLIGLSTLLVWQHHVIDVASGFLMAWLVTVLIPDPRQLGTRSPSQKHAVRYGAGAIACGVLSLLWMPILWPAIACALMALAYATGRSRFLCKENGTLSPAAEWCLLPVLVVTAQIQRKWLKRIPGWYEVTPGVLFGRRVNANEALQLVEGGDLAVLDLTAEANAPAPFRERAIYHNLPLLDLVELQPGHIQLALEFIREKRDGGRRVFLHCKLGLERSALVAAHWLVETGAAPDLESAKQRIRALEPQVVI